MIALKADSSAGFTLFEVLVVIVITSLIGAVLMQGFSALLATRLSVAGAIGNLQEAVLSQNIVVDPLRGLIPDYEDNANVFRGQPRSLSGQTLRPLLAPAGAPAAFKMTLDYDANRNLTVLIYEELGRAKAEIASWAGNTGTFRYRDLNGSWLSAWPPPTSTSQTPWLIWIDGGPSLAPLIASVVGPHKRVTRLEDSPFGSAGRIGN
jgi:prepilin-type N-terminal cleavage/methylation domain-containing protein